MEVCKYIVPSRHWINSRNSSREVGERGKEMGGHPKGVLPRSWGETELNRSVTCMEFDRRHLAICRDEFHGP
ncbi:hypothetical protein TNCV_589871 [Trichonephila clavipes]|nr:hypothetical protein TNCV_589871 [Trichonephila clavipes]